MEERPVVVKVGGSLFDLDGLGPRLDAWLQTLSLPRVLVVPGGGPFANVIRQLDAQHGLGEEPSHQLAMASLSLAARFLAAIVPRAVGVDTFSACAELWEKDRIPVLDPLPILAG